MAKLFRRASGQPAAPADRQVVDLVREGGLIAYPTDSCFALGCRLGNRDGLERIREIRRLDDRHHFTLVCRDFSQLGQFVQIDNAVFRAGEGGHAGKLHLHPAGHREVPRRLLHPKKKDRRGAGHRAPVAQALLAELGEPLLSSTLLLPARPSR